MSFCSEEEKEVLDLIEDYIGHPINVIEISKIERVETIDFTNDVTDNWQSVMKDIELDKQFKKKKSRKKKKGK